MKKHRDSVSHRKYSIRKAIARYKKTRKFTYRGKGNLKGSGHAAGREWGAKKGINPDSKTLKYSKNSPSFDEGVYQYKESARNRVLNNKK